MLFCFIRVAVFIAKSVVMAAGLQKLTEVAAAEIQRRNAVVTPQREGEAYVN